MNLEYSYFLQSLNKKLVGVPVFPLTSPNDSLELFEALKDTKFEVLVFRLGKENIKNEAERWFYRKLHHILDYILKVPYFVIFDAGADENSAKQGIRDGYKVVEWEVLFMSETEMVYDKVHEMTDYAREHKVSLVGSIGKFQDGQLISPLSQTRIWRDIFLSSGLAGFKVEVIDNVQKDFVARGIKQIDFELVNRIFLETSYVLSLEGGRYFKESLAKEITKLATIPAECSLTVSEHGIRKAIEKGLRLFDLGQDFEVYYRLSKESNFSDEKRNTLLREMLNEYEVFFGYKK